MNQTHAPRDAAPGPRIVQSGRRPRALVYQDADALQRDLDRRSGLRRGEDRRAAASTGALALGVRELCHDARQSLATVRALLQQLDEQARLSQVGHRLVEELDALCALFEGQLQPPSPVRVDLAQLADETVDRVRPRADVRICVVADGHPVVTGDPLLLGRMVLNLLDNACRSVRPGGLVRVRVHADRASEEAVVDVEDEGLPTLDADRPPPGPTGQRLGLAVVQAAVAQHGGTALTERSSLGGWRVQVRLPLDAGPESAGVAT